METFSALLAFCAGNSPVTGELPAQRPVTRSFDVFSDLCLNQQLSKQRRRRWFETPSRSLWRHSNAIGSCNGCVPNRRQSINLSYPNTSSYTRRWTRSNIGSGNGLSPAGRIAIAWTNVDLSCIGSLGINFSEIPNQIQKKSLTKMHMKLLSRTLGFCPRGWWKLNQC